MQRKLVPVILRKARQKLNMLPRNIASGVRNPGIGSGSISNGTNTTQNCRASHHNESGVALDQVSLIYGGWYTDTISEVPNANAYTVAASVEYPAGVYTQVTWDAGSTTKSIGIGLNVASDYINVNIPAGAQFWTWTYVVVTAGQTWPLCRSLSATLGELCEFGVGLTDKTMVGGISGTQTGLRPAAIVSPWKPGMKKVSLAGLGDSIVYGSGDDLYDNRGNTSWIGRASSNNCPYMPITVGGTTLASQVVANKMNYRLDLMNKAGVTHIICNWGVNDVGAGFSTFQNNLNTLWALFRAALPNVKIYHCTIGPRGTSNLANGNYYTNAGQTPHADYNGPAAVGNLINAYIRTIPSPLDGFIENADKLSSARDSGIWKNGQEQPDADLLGADSLTVTGSPTTTNVPYTPLRPSGYFLVGISRYTSGALSGSFYGGSQFSSSGSALTYGAAPLASAPTAGDTLTAWPAAARCTVDGLHPGLAAKGNTAVLGGGHIVLMTGLIPVLQAWNA